MRIHKLFWSLSLTLAVTQLASPASAKEPNLEAMRVRHLRERRELSLSTNAQAVVNTRMATVQTAIQLNRRLLDAQGKLEHLMNFGSVDEDRLEQFQDAAEYMLFEVRMLNKHALTVADSEFYSLAQALEERATHLVRAAKDYVQEVSTHQEQPEGLKSVQAANWAVTQASLDLIRWTTLQFALAQNQQKYLSSKTPIQPVKQAQPKPASKKPLPQALAPQHERLSVADGAW